MGIDIQIYVKGDVSDEELDRARDEWDFRIYDARLERSDWDHDKGRVQVDQTYIRYWGPGYERGPWPQIASWIEAMSAAFPNRDICYGGDDDDDETIPIVTDDMMRKFWAHWRSPKAHDYERS